MKKSAILCVDDEAIISLSLIQELKNSFAENFDYLMAMNASHAFEIIAELDSEGIQISLIISDWQMPGMKGDEFLDVVALHHPLTKAIILTGHVDETSLIKIRQNKSVCAVLSKPWNFAVLRKLVGECCILPPQKENS